MGKTFHEHLLLQPSRGGLVLTVLSPRYGYPQDPASHCLSRNKAPPYFLSYGKHNLDRVKHPNFSSAGAVQASPLHISTQFCINLWFTWVFPLNDPCYRANVYPYSTTPLAQVTVRVYDHTTVHTSPAQETTGSAPNRILHSAQSSSIAPFPAHHSDNLAPHLHGQSHTAHCRRTQMDSPLCLSQRRGFPKRAIEQFDQRLSHKI
jgi:hypothetical protein